MPVAGETIIPPNYGIGFGQFTANLRLSKTFGFGKEVQGGNAVVAAGGGGGGHYGRGLGPGGLSSMGNGGNMFGRGSVHQPPVQPHLQRLRAEYL